MTNTQIDGSRYSFIGRERIEWIEPISPGSARVRLRNRPYIFTVTAQRGTGEGGRNKGPTILGITITPDEGKTLNDMGQKAIPWTTLAAAAVNAHKPTS